MTASSSPVSADERPEVESHDSGYEKPEPPEAPRPKYLAPHWKEFRRFVRGLPGEIWIAAGGLVFLGFVILMVFVLFLNTHPVRVTVESFSWERRTEIEQFSQVRDGRWYDYPSDAYDVSHSQKVHHYNSVYVGQVSCGKNCTRAQYVSVPEYATWYSYTVDRWITGRWLVSSGEDHQPSWPVLPTTLNPSPVLGNEREGNDHKQKYTAHTDKGYDLGVSPGVFEVLRVGSTGVANVNRQDDVRSVNWDKEVTT